jgi:hypothetical protein
MTADPGVYDVSDCDSCGLIAPCEDDTCPARVLPVLADTLPPFWD